MKVKVSCDVCTMLQQVCNQSENVHMFFQATMIILSHICAKNNNLYENSQKIKRLVSTQAFYFLPLVLACFSIFP
jgi:hypothetical protein